jgi:hypothetical protein
VSKKNEPTIASRGAQNTLSRPAPSTRTCRQEKNGGEPPWAAAGVRGGSSRALAFAPTPHAHASRSPPSPDSRMLPLKFSIPNCPSKLTAGAAP